MKMARILLFSYLSLIMLIPVTGQSVQDKPADQAKKRHEAFELFGSNDVLNISLRFDLATFLKKNLKGKFLDGMLTISTGKGDSIVKEVWVNTRGVFRLQYCGFPPMELEFKKPFYAYNYSATIKKLKLATQCQASDLFEDYIFKEYLVYRIFNQFTDTSYRVRLIKATYKDNKKLKKPVEQYGFFIEPQGVLADRLNSDVLKNVEITQRNISQTVMTRMAIFNYMIGNYDWAVPNQHNVTILQSKDPDASQLPVVVPHDFDWTGLVNPIYAIPTENIGIESVKDRLFLGICLSREGFKKELLKFLPYKQKIYSLINDFEYLNQKSKKEMTDYLEEFFGSLESPSKLNLLIDKIMSTCKQI